MKIACSHPGKVGDMLYSLPTVRYLCEKWNCKADFYTSKNCEIARELLEMQDCIDQVIIPHGYRVERTDMGVQPFQMPINLGEYEVTYHLGFRSIPDRRLDHFIALQIGISPEALPRVYYDFEKVEVGLPKCPFYILDTRQSTSYDNLWIEWSKRCNMCVMIVGSPNNWIPGFEHCVNMTGLPFHYTPYLMSMASGFAGIMSSHLVLANGFNMPKVIPHDGISWDMRHVIYTDKHHYLVNPSVEEVLQWLP